MSRFIGLVLWAGLYGFHTHAETHLVGEIGTALLGAPPSQRASGTANQQKQYRSPGSQMLEDYASSWNGDFKNKRYNLQKLFGDADRLVRAQEEKERKDFIKAQSELKDTWANTEDPPRKKGFSPGGHRWNTPEALEESRRLLVKDNKLFDEINRTFDGSIKDRLNNTGNKEEVIAAINALRHSASETEYKANLETAFKGLAAAGISPRLVFGANGAQLGHPFANTSQWQGTYWKVLNTYDKQDLGSGS